MMLFVCSDDPVKLCSVDIGFENFYFVKKEISVHHCYEKQKRLVYKITSISLLVYVKST